VPTDVFLIPADFGIQVHCLSADKNTPVTLITFFIRVVGVLQSADELLPAFGSCCVVYECLFVVRRQCR